MKIGKALTMKNNGFKKVITNKIKNECKTFDFVCVAVDESNNSRMIYIYTLEYVCVGVFALWINDESIHLQFTQDFEKSMILADKEEVRVKNCNFDKVIKLIQDAFDIMDNV